MIQNLENVEERYVYLSNRLIEASYTLTVLEQKLLRVLASMVNKDDIDFKEYNFMASDLMILLNTSSKNFYKELDNVTDLLMKRLVKIKDIDNNDFEKYHFVDTAKYRNGILTLKIHPELKPFYLNLDWYSKYKLANILKFKSKHSFRIYELLKQYQSMGERLITIDDLRFKLEITDEEYPKYSNLKQKVLLKAQKELNEKTDLNFEFEEIKTGRKVTSIKFFIKSNKNMVHAPKEKQAKNEIAIDKETPLDLIQDDIKAIMDLTNNEFSEKTVMLFRDLSNGDIGKIKKLYDYMNTKNIKENRTGYMRKILEDWEEPKQSSSVNGFNNFEAREYDYNSLERKLLGWD